VPKVLLVVEKQKPQDLATSNSPSLIPLRAVVWALRTLVLVVIAFLCVIAGSFSPAFAFALSLGPSVLFVAAFLTGVLQFPRFLKPVHPMEPVLYRWVGVGLVKRVVATRIWPAFVGVVPPPRPTKRDELFDYIEHSTEGAEICHWPTFVLALFIALLCLAVGRSSLAGWILVLNLILNGYPIMLQRSNRWRLHRLRANAF
jgi:hypothetical protein